MKSPFPGMAPYLEPHWRDVHHGRYDDLDYRADLTPPLDPAEAQWAEQWLASRGLRSSSPHASERAAQHGDGPPQLIVVRLFNT
jgi:hypothetical protein